MSQPTKARHGATTNHHREAGTAIVPPPAQKRKEENENEFLVYAKFHKETV